MLSGLADGGELRALWIIGDEVLELLGVDLPFFAEHRHLLGDVFELSDVSRPLIVEHELLGIVCESDLRQMVFVGHLHGEEPEEQQYIVAPLAQRRHLYGDGVEPVEEVFTEASLRDRLAHVDVSGGDDAHVGLSDLLSAYADILSRLEHSEQSCLCGHGQLTYLVEEDGAFVGDAEISLALSDGSGVGTFFVAEELAVDGTLGDGTAVDGEVSLTAPG